MIRADGRAHDELRPHEIICDFVSTADGSCLISTGGTKVICTASIDESVPPFLRGKGEGWVTAEYAMLPASTGRRKQRDGIKKDGRGVEIGRLIGRALRQAVDRKWLGERTITIDCDVLEADGGTRTASITGGFVALVCAVDKLIKQGKLKESPIVHQIAAVSAGVCEGEACLDLCYIEDSAAETDMNFVMDETGAMAELQGTGEGRAFTRDELEQLLDLGEAGIAQLQALQRRALGERAKHICPKRTLVLASNNRHKIIELSEMLGDSYTVLSMKEAGVTGEAVEDGETFEANAVIKAEFVTKQTGYAALADDSGLAVDALDGAPGVHSARYCGWHGDDAANNRMLMENMKDIPMPERTAQFVCAMALSTPFGKTRVVTGTCPGLVTTEPRGTREFGYDPYFEYLDGRTFSEMPDEEKNKISHRARAMQQMLPILKEEL